MRPRSAVSSLLTWMCQASTENRFQQPGTPLRSCSPRSANSRPEPATRSVTVRDTSTWLGWASEATRSKMHSDSSQVSASLYAFTCVDPGAQLETEWSVVGFDRDWTWVDARSGCRMVPSQVDNDAPWPDR